MASIAVISLMPDEQNFIRRGLQRNSILSLTDKYNNILEAKDMFSLLNDVESSESSEEPVPQRRKTILRESRATSKKSKEDRCKQLKSILKILDTFLIALSLSGLLSEIYNFQYNYSMNDHTNRFYYSNSKLNDLINTINLIFTLFSIVIVIIRSYVSYNIKRERKYLLEDHIKPYFNSSSFVTLSVDLVILMILPIPYYDYQLDFEQIHGVIYINLNIVFFSYTMLRFLFLFRIYLHYSKWSTLKIQKICRQHGVGHPLIFSLKSTLKDRPYLLLIPAFGISTFGLGITLSVYERPFNQQNSSFEDINGTTILNYSSLYNSMWLVLLTMTTVGYGDFYPRTNMGRLIAIVAITWGTFLISLMIIMFNNYVVFTRPQEKSFRYLSKLEKYQKVKKYAGYLVNTSIRLYIYYKHRKYSERHFKIVELRKEFLKYRKLFRAALKAIKSSNESTRDSLITLNEHLNIDIKKLEKTLDYSLDIENQLDTIIESQERSIEILKGSHKVSVDCGKLISFYSN